MKHQNPDMNVTLEEANKLRDFLNAVNFLVSEVVCNPNTFGQRGVNMVPEANIPQDGQPYNLELRFEGVVQTFPAATVRNMLGEPSLSSLALLHGALWPSGAHSDLDARLLRVPLIQVTVGAVIRAMGLEAGLIAKLVQGSPVSPPETAPVATRKPAKKKAAKKATTKKAKVTKKTTRKASKKSGR